MSSIPGYTLEAFVMWDIDLIVDGDGSANKSLQIAEALGHKSSRLKLTKEQFKPILDLYEPYRAQIESLLLDFDEENQSWRDYAGALGVPPEEVSTKAYEIKVSLKKQFEFEKE